MLVNNSPDVSPMSVIIMRAPGIGRPVWIAEVWEAVGEKPCGCVNRTRSIVGWLIGSEASDAWELALAAIPPGLPFWKAWIREDDDGVMPGHGLFCANQ